MDEEIRKDNKVPGSCEQFTKPEEILALSKYLRKLRTEYEENTSLEKDKIGVIGFNGQLKNEVPLSDKVEKIESNENVALSNSVIEVGGGEKKVDLSKEVSKIEGVEEKELSRTVEKIDDSREIPLSTEIDTIKDNRENELSRDVEKIQDTREQSLSKEVERLNDLRENELSKTVETISDERVQTLSSLVEKIGDGNKEPVLSQEVEKVINSGTTDNALSKNLERILGGKRKSATLSKHVSKVEVNNHKDAELSEVVSKIEGVGDDLQLGKEVSMIKDDKEYKLSEDVSKIEGIRDQAELSKTRAEINDTRDVQLAKKRSKLEGDKKKEQLSKKVSKIEKTEGDPSLSRDVSRIEGNKKDQKLSKKVSKVERAEQTPNLSSDVSKVGGNMKEPKLSREVSKVSDNISDPGLSKEVSKISDNRTNNLSKTVSKIEGDKKEAPNLSSDVSKVGDNNKEPELSKEVRKIEKGDHEYPLSKKISKIENTEKNPQLSKKVSKIDDKRDYPLSDVISKINDTRDNQLSTEISKIEDTREDLELSRIVGKVISDAATDQHTQFNPESDGLYDSVLAVNDNQGGNAEELSTKVAKVERTKKDPDLSNKRSDLNIENKDLELSREVSKVEVGDKKIELSKEVNKPGNDDVGIDVLVNKIRDYKDLNNYYQNLLHFLQDKSINKGWAAKISSLMSTYLSGNKISPENIKKFEAALYREAMMSSPRFRPRTKLPGFGIDSINANNYLRFIAETVLGRGWGKGLGQKARAVLLDETLSLLVYERTEQEKKYKVNRDRLPGKPSIITDAARSGLRGAIEGGFKRVKDAATGLIHGESIEKKYPINRPYDKEEQKEADARGEYQSWTKANSKGESIKGMSIKSIANRLVDAAIGKVPTSPSDYQFNQNYLGNGAFQGMNTTLEDLCNVSDVGEIRTVQDLFDTFEKSPYITTAGKVVGGKNNPLKVMTLDTNSYWEIIFEPFVGLSENGGKSFLPPIEEINLWNKLDHGVMTAYNRWLPIVAFEMQKSKLTTKTAGLYDGEISFPTSIEFSNEFRLTIADDQYKSFRTYFERCMEVSVFNSEAHDFLDYGQDGFNNFVGYQKPYNKITSVDKKFTCIAPYKNVTFKCTIYCMTPQKSTINKYELLLTLKDFIEERSGEIESGGNDLTVAFSIVGENPDHGGAIQVDSDKVTSIPEKLGTISSKFNKPIKISPKKVKIIG